MEKALKEIEKNANYLNMLTNKEIVDILEYLSNEYYNNNNGIVSDETYDLIYDFLKQRDSKNKFFKKIGYPINDKNKQKLPYFMGSLNKIKNEKDIDKWKNTYNNDFIVSDKLDGISGQVYKDNNGIINLYTRGDGFYGKNLNHLLKHIFDENIFKKIENNMSIRGEFIISKQDFIKIQSITDYKNARNFVGGVINSDSVNKKYIQYVKFIPYGILHPLKTISEQLNILTNIFGWDNIVTYKQYDTITFDILEKYYLERRFKSVYEIDGLVVEHNKLYDKIDENPKHAFAFKMNLDTQIKTTTVRKVKWEVSMYGYLKPTVKFDSVNINGVDINKATGHNAKFITENKIGAGAVIEIIRSGDVIPYINKIITPVKTPDMPTKIDYKWTTTNVDIYVINYTKKILEKITIKKMVYFFKTLDVKYISEGIIKLLYKNNYTSILLILSANKNNLYKLNGLGKTVVDKIFNEFNIKLKNIENMGLLMASSLCFGRGLGTGKLTLISNAVPNILDINKKDKLENTLQTIAGLDVISINQFIDGYDDFINFYNSIKNYINIKMGITINKNGIFKEMNVVLTGFRDKNIEDFVIKNGGMIKTSISNKTNVVIYKIKNSEKYIKASEIKTIELISYDDFIKQYKL